jgi:hypothetical protein
MEFQMHSNVHNNPPLITMLVVLGGLAVAYLPLDPISRVQTRLTTTDFLRAIKVSSTASFGGQVKPSAPCRRFTACWSNLRVWKRYFVGKIRTFPSPSSSCFATRLLYWQDCRRALVDESRVTSVDFIPPWLIILTYHLQDEQWGWWWQQFRDVISPHRDKHEQLLCFARYIQLTSYSFKIPFNIILAIMPRTPSGLYLQVLRSKLLIHFSRP